MKPEEYAKETKETLDTLHDIQEIERVIYFPPDSPYFDRHEAERLICEHNQKDAYIGVVNNCSPNSVPVTQASNAALWNTLNSIRAYLAAKRTKELMEKGNTNANA